jgi:hypothetical protein
MEPQPGSLPDPLDDLGPVQEKLVPDDGVGRMDNQPAALVDPHRVRIGGVGRPDDLGPLVPDRLLGRGRADPVLRPQAVDQLDELMRDGRLRMPLGSSEGIRRSDAIRSSAALLNLWGSPGIRKQSVPMDAADRPRRQTLAPATPSHLEAGQGNAPQPEAAPEDCRARAEALA